MAEELKELVSVNAVKAGEGDCGRKGGESRNLFVDEGGNTVSDGGIDGSKVKVVFGAVDEKETGLVPGGTDAAGDQ